jgi:hypothetical protein
MGTIRVRVEGNTETSSHSNGDMPRETTREIKEIFGGGASRVIPFDTAELAESLRGLSTQLGDLFAGLRAVAGYELQEVQVALEISAEGGFNLIGSAKAGGKGAITLTFAPGRASNGTDNA